MEGPIVGVFDSGLGGLTVLSSCARFCSGVRFLYYGDNARAPYGSRPREEIARFTEEALTLFRERGASAAVLACNTATAACAGEMREKFSFPILGMEPAVRPAALSCKNVLVLATPHTAKSERLKALIVRHPSCRFTVFAAERLAAAIEQSLTGGESLVLSDHLPPPEGYDGVVLGCTHYVFFAREIARFYGCKVFDGNEGTARHLGKVLEGLKNLGMNFHQTFPQNPNNCLTFKSNKGEERRVEFVGNGAKTNFSVFISNICFKNFSK